MTALMILAVFFPALAGVLVWLLPAAKEDRALRAKLNCGALALELVVVIALCTAQGTEALLLNMKKLLDELGQRNVFDENTTVETKKEAACIAMQYLVDRVGGLFEAFGGIENSPRMRIMALLSEYLRTDRARLIDGVSDSDRNECVMAAVLYLFMGGMEPLQGE